MAGADRSKIKDIGFAEKIELKDEFIDASEIVINLRLSIL